MFTNPQFFRMWIILQPIWEGFHPNSSIRIIIPSQFNLILASQLILLIENHLNANQLCFRIPVKDFAQSSVTENKAILEPALAVLKCLKVHILFLTQVIVLCTQCLDPQSKPLRSKSSPNHRHSSVYLDQGSAWLQFTGTYVSFSFGMKWNRKIDVKRLIQRTSECRTLA